MRAAELGRMGGRKNRHSIEIVQFSFAPPKTPEDVKNMVSEAMVGMLSDKIDRKKANSLTYMSSFLLKAIESTDVKRGLKPFTREMEELLKKS